MREEFEKLISQVWICKEIILKPVFLLDLTLLKTILAIISTLDILKTFSIEVRCNVTTMTLILKKNNYLNF